MCSEDREKARGEMMWQYYFVVTFIIFLYVAMGIFSIWILRMAYVAVCGDMIEHDRKVAEIRSQWKKDGG